MLSAVAQIPDATSLLVLSAASSSTSWFLQYLFQWHPLGRKWKAMLLRKSRGRRAPRWRRNIAKPLGLCVYCQSFWIAVAYWLVYSSELPMLAPMVAFNYVFVEVMRGWCE